MDFSLSHPLLASYQNSDIFGKIIFICLFASSCISWIFIVADFKKLKRIQKESLQIKSLFEKSTSHPLHCEILKSHPLASLFNTLKKHALAFLNKNQSDKENPQSYLSQSDIEALRHQATTYIGSTHQKLGQHLFLLSTMTSLAPFLGLLGTVWGILLTFSELQSGLHLQAQATVMGGLAMALGTTVIGLLVAIPSLIGHNVIKSKVEEVCFDIENFADRIVASLELNYKQVEVA